MIPRKICEVCGLPSRDNICDVCYPLVRAKQEGSDRRQWMTNTWPMDRVALMRRVSIARN